MSKALRETPTRLKRQLSKRYSVMIHAGPESGLRQFSMPAVALPLVVGVCALGLIAGGGALLGWTSSRIEQTQLTDLRMENTRLVTQLDDMRETVELFEARMAETAEMEREFRNLANLERIPDDILRLGIGGPLPFAELADQASPYPQVRRAREALQRLDDLNRQAHFQTANFREMVDMLKDSRDELDHIPSIIPVRQGWFSSGYGMRKDPFTARHTMHRGLDFSAWTGTPVYATATGRVRKAGKSGTLGLLVEIDHGNDTVTRYGHNSRLLVKVGQQVRRGDAIAEVGSTGRSTSPHCHYEIHEKGRHVNPWRYILDGGPRMNSGA